MAGRNLWAGLALTPLLIAPIAALALTQLKQVYVSTLHAEDRITIDKAPLVFVGYGVSAPERQWDAFKSVRAASDSARRP